MARLRRFDYRRRGAAPRDRAGDAEVLRWCLGVVERVNALEPEMRARTAHRAAGLDTA